MRCWQELSSVQSPCRLECQSARSPRSRRQVSITWVALRRSSAYGECRRSRPISHPRGRARDLSQAASERGTKRFSQLPRMHQLGPRCSCGEANKRAAGRTLQREGGFARGPRRMTPTPRRLPIERAGTPAPGAGAPGWERTSGERSLRSVRRATGAAVRTLGAVQATERSVTALQQLPSCGVRPRRWGWEAIGDVGCGGARPSLASTVR
jgi:hypothetical protein